MLVLLEEIVVTDGRVPGHLNRRGVGNAELHALGERLFEDPPGLG